MQIPNNAAVKPFVEADLGNLLVGRFSESEPIFIAMRTELQESTGEPTPYLAILSSWVDGQSRAFLCKPHSGPVGVLDLGRDWAVDVSINDESMHFFSAPDCVLLRSGNGYYCCLDSSGMYLDFTTGLITDTIPDRINAVYWSAFSISIPQSGGGEQSAEIFRWPRNSEK